MERPVKKHRGEEGSNGDGNGQVHAVEQVQMEGLTYVENFITNEEERELLEHIDRGQWLFDLKRRVQHYGYKYDYKYVLVAIYCNLSSSCTKSKGSISVAHLGGFVQKSQYQSKHATGRIARLSKRAHRSTHGPTRPLQTTRPGYHQRVPPWTSTSSPSTPSNGPLPHELTAYM